jgi:rhamnulose-1-phosphate aldolase/alcohol dehydrogenase
MTANAENEARSAVTDLLERSHRLGADTRNTNYAGGNASVKASNTDPVTGDAVELLWVKGSGGDLGTLTETGLAVLRLDRLHALSKVKPAAGNEEEMVADLDYCLFGKGGAAPSIDTAMHGLLSYAHVDHLHPEASIGLATAAESETLTREIFDGRVGWVPWLRPGFELGIKIAEMAKADPDMIGIILAGHGITAWGATTDECEANSLKIVRRVEEFVRERGRPDPLGPAIEGMGALPDAERRERAMALLPFVRGLASADRRQVGHYDDSHVVLDFLSRESAAEVAARGGSCPDHFVRTKIRPIVLDLPGDAPIDAVKARLTELDAEFRAQYRAYYHDNATPDSPPIRGADPHIVLVPGIGMFSFGQDKQTARVAGAFYVNGIHAMHAAESISTYAPISDADRFAVEYWILEEAKLQRRPKPKPLSTRIALVTGAGSGIGRAIAHRLAAEGANVVVSDLDEDAARAVAEEIGSTDVAIAVRADVSSEDEVAAAVGEAVLAFGGLDLVVNNAGLSITRPLAETSLDIWDLQHDVMARGSFLVSREATRIMIEQGIGGDIVYVASKNAVVAGPSNVAYSASKADQAHQVRLLAAELGEHGIRVNAVNPDGVVQGSGIFAGDWGEQRAAHYGVDRDKLGEYYAGRTLLKREVLPEHVAGAVLVLVAGELSRTTGTYIPVDSGIAAAFPR